MAAVKGLLYRIFLTRAGSRLAAKRTAPRIDLWQLSGLENMAKSGSRAGFLARAADGSLWQRTRLTAHSGCLKIKQALVPPKPKEFDMAISTSRRRASCGTRSISVATDA